MMTSIIIIHVIACVVLIALVLIQRGRGSGLVESFQGVESMFGTKTNAFLTRTTTVMSIVFFLTCLSLAVLSVKQSRSLMRDIKTTEPIKQTPAAGASEPAKPVTQEKPQAQADTSQKAQKTEELPKAE